MKRIQVFAVIFLLMDVIMVYSNQPIIADTNSPVITEFVADNSDGLMDEDGDFPDWIELFNPTGDSINMEGWYLTDNSSNLLKWKFPKYKIEPGGYLIVFLSGKSKVYDGINMHADFKLSASGEFLALIKAQSAIKTWYFEGIFPQQYENVSYALIGDKYKYTTHTTPGAANIYKVFIPDPIISLPHGFYFNPIDVEIQAMDTIGEIYYTLDGTSPIDGNRIKYTGPLHFDSTALLRAVIISEGFDTSNSVTRSFIYPEYVLQQPILPEGYPEEWGPFVTNPSVNAPGDYEMDPDIVNHPEYKDSMVLSLLSIPSISIVTNKDYFFLDSIDDEVGGIYIYTGPPITDYVSGIGKDWERPASVEYIIPGSDEGFQINCGVQLNGGHSRRPEKCPKHSIRLLFKNEYGPGRLDYDIFDGTDAVKSFDRLILRGGFNNTWNHLSSGQRADAQYIQDSWAKDTQRDMEHISAHNKFAHLYINGLYWGLYNISERIDDEFMQSYYGGNDEDYDVIKDYTEALRGNLDAWNLMGEMLFQASDDEAYYRLLGKNPDGTDNPSYEKYIDPVSIIDYMLINFYGGNTDWDHHNWISARGANTTNGFQFLIWDAEHIFEGLDHYVIDEYNYNCPSWVFRSLCENRNFINELEERINLHFFNDGALTPHMVTERYKKRAEEVRLAIMSESARWGDSRVWEPYNLHDDWEETYNNLIYDYFPNRTNVVLEQLKIAGLYPQVEKPVFTKNGGSVEKGYVLGMTSSVGTIFYTLDGSDPRNGDGGYSSSAKMYESGGVVIKEDVTVKARTQFGDEWSALTEASFWVLTDNIAEFKFVDYGIEHIRLFPNPTRFNTNIEYMLNSNCEVSMSIYNSNGMLVLKQKPGLQDLGWHIINIDVSAFSPGIYIIQVMDGSNIYNQRMEVY